MLTYTEPQSSVFCLWNDVLIALSMLAVYLATLYTLTSARFFLERWEKGTFGTKCFLGSLVCLPDGYKQQWHPLEKSISNSACKVFTHPCLAPHPKGLASCWGESGSQKFVEMMPFCEIVQW